MKNTLITCSAVVLLSACGTFQLGDVQPQAGKAPEQQQLDTLQCKDEARLTANSTGRQTGAFFLGMTIVGAPLAYELEKSTQRQVFAECLAAKGYKVIPPDGESQNTANLKAPAAKATGLPLTPEVERLTQVVLPDGFVKNAVPDTLRAAGWQLFASNKTTDTHVVATTFKRDVITDVKTYATARLAGQTGMLGESQSSEVVPVTIKEVQGFRYEITGSLKNGTRVSYVVTVLEYQQQVMQISTWTPAGNLANQKEAMLQLASYFLN